MMNAFTFQSVQFADRKGVEIHVKERQVQNTYGDDERQVQLSDDEAEDLLKWLRRWNNVSTDDPMDYWLPTSENVNNLPRPIRNYIHHLETNADPAGTIRDAIVAKENTAALEKQLEELRGVKSELLGACRLALQAFERNDAIDWRVLERAIARASR